MKNGKYIQSDGSIRWFKNDHVHREDGPAIESPNGTKQWLINGQLHRKEGPAVEQFNGGSLWYLHDKLHREDGPAIENGDGTKLWYLHDIHFSEEEFQHLLDKKNLHQKLKNTLAIKPIQKRTKI